MPPPKNPPKPPNFAPKPPNFPAPKASNPPPASKPPTNNVGANSSKTGSSASKPSTGKPPSIPNQPTMKATTDATRVAQYGKHGAVVKAQQAAATAQKTSQYVQLMGQARKIDAQEQNKFRTQQQVARQAQTQKIIDSEAKRDANRAQQWKDIGRVVSGGTGTTNKPPKFPPDKPPRGPKNPGVLVVRNPDTPGPPQPPTFFTPPTNDEEDTEVAGSFGAASYTAAPAPRQSLVPARDVVDFTTPPPSVEAMQQVLFEELSSFELVNMARRDTVEGLNPYYSVISNLASIRTQYDPSKIISLQDSLQITDLYQISLDSKIPSAEYLARNNITNFFYIDTNGDFVIELDNLLPDEFVEIQIASSGKIT
jgi:hypothetical protein